ncbi:hypothetical protein ACQEVC_10715 [Plantactinospora sp. CA-294935]|uniref:hypothetical protein n=1 Tax=Plantactinospora sp. CA-294935 TaxID=3240012 RepID=UPI003D8D0216
MTDRPLPPEPSDHVDLTDPSNPDSQPTARGHAGDVQGRPRDEGEDEGEGFECQMSFRMLWRWRGAQDLLPTELLTRMVPRTGVIVPPAIIFGLFLGSGATLGATATATGVVAAISIATGLSGNGPRRSTPDPDGAATSVDAARAAGPPVTASPPAARATDGEEPTPPVPEAGRRTGSQSGEQPTRPADRLGGTGTHSHQETS